VRITKTFFAVQKSRKNLCVVSGVLPEKDASRKKQEKKYSLFPVITGCECLNNLPAITIRSSSAFVNGNNTVSKRTLKQQSGG
jgi:hypothetical protein